MSSVVRIPPELGTFLTLQNPQTLMIRGPPGSGKTMLALALMEAFKGRKVYVSLRVTRQSLLQQIPWLGTVPAGEFEIVDASIETDRVQGHAGAVADSKSLVEEPGGVTRDARDFLWLPSAAQAAWSLASAHRPTLMVFDSWDAIIEQYFERVGAQIDSLPSRAEVERLLLTRMAKGNVALVLVLEHDTPTVLDYCVNGIVETSRHLEEARLERWLSLPKLRGIAIGTDTYPFTLVNGRFSAITATPAGDHYRLASPVADPHPTSPGIWPGSTDYAEALGRLPNGALTVVEVDSAVPREVPRVIVGPMLLSTIRDGGRVLIISPPSTDPEDSYLALRDHLSAGLLRERMRILTAVPFDPREPELTGVFVPPHRVGWAKTGSPVPVPEDPGFLRDALDSEHANLIVAYLSGLESLAEGAGVTVARGVLAGLASAIFPRSRVHLVAVGRAGDPLFNTVAPVAETQLRIRAPHGRVFLNGHRPYLAPLVLSQEIGDEPYRLTPVL